MTVDFISKNLIYFQAFNTLFISILLEAFPFIMLGVLISSILHVFVSEETIRRIVPNNKFLGAVIGATMGLLFPVCDCAVIPVARRLIKKGVPIHIAITFMLAAPIINPVVIIATIYAFKSKLPSMIYYRTCFGVIIAIAIGYILGLLYEKKNILKKEIYHEHDEQFCCHHNNESEEELSACEHHKHNHNKKTAWDNISEIVRHSGEEFFDVGKYIIIGAFITTLFQVFVPRSIIITIGHNTVLSVLVMMMFAFILSLCSTSDSFIAKTFIGQFTNSSILAFLLIGPMIDVKNTIVLFGNFKSKFVARLVGFIFILCFVTALTLNYLKII